VKRIEDVLRKIAPHLFNLQSERLKKRSEKILKDERRATEKQIKFLRDLIADFKERFQSYMSTKGEEIKRVDKRQYEKVMWIKEIVDEIEASLSMFNRSTISYAINFLKETKWIK